jgi:SAM-dependent methyltransferase
VPHRGGFACTAPALAEGSHGFDAELFKKLVRFEETNFWFVSRAKLIVRLIKSHFPDVRNLLEIGCGTGSVLLALRREFANADLLGSELNLQGLAFARQRLDPSVSLLQMDAQNIPATSMFDVIGAFDVIEHIEDDEKVLRSIAVALRPGGVSVIAVPQHRWLWSQEDEAAHHVRRYARGELEEKLARAGFTILRSTSFNAILLPLMVASRLKLRLQSWRGVTAEPLSEMEIGGRLNKLLTLALSLEVFLTGCGFSWPAGGSRFVVARKAPQL